VLSLAGEGGNHKRNRRKINNSKKGKRKKEKKGCTVQATYVSHITDTNIIKNVYFLIFMKKN
jgi:hypothetical protein